MTLNPTEEFYQLLNQAYAHFNEQLFDGNLPWCMLTLQRNRNTMGYFSAERWVDGKGLKAHEIALNPAYFARHRVIDVLQTLVHEQCHLWQHLFGRHNSRTGYHNREWAEKMEEIGLMPSSTGEIGGRKTGQSMSDYPKTGGRFLNACLSLTKGEYQLKWIDTEPAWQPSCQPRDKEASAAMSGASLSEESAYLQDLWQEAPALLAMVPTAEAQEEINWSQPDKKRLSKSKYSCPQCAVNIWGKPGLNINCGDCGARFEMAQTGGIE
jgi:predicted SprT family Zn-dependent metalloprotease